jgi:hypothetical protein
MVFVIGIRPIGWSPVDETGKANYTFIGQEDQILKTCMLSIPQTVLMDNLCPSSFNRYQTGDICFKGVTYSELHIVSRKCSSRMGYRWLEGKGFGTGNVPEFKTKSIKTRAAKRPADDACTHRRCGVTFTTHHALFSCLLG